MYCIAGNFRLEKIFAFFRPGASWAKIFSTNYFTQWKICHAEIFYTHVFTRGCLAVLVVPCNHQSAVLPGIQILFFLDLQPSLMSLLSYFHVAARVSVPDLAGPLSSELSPRSGGRPTLLWMAYSKQIRPRKRRENEDYARANTILRYSGVACSFESSTHWWATRAVLEIKFGEIFVPIQSMSTERNFYPAKILCYTVLHMHVH